MPSKKIRCVYRLIHEDGPYYYGGTDDLRTRSKNHRRDVKVGKSDFYKYVQANGGWKRVTLEIVKHCSEEENVFIEEGVFIDEHWEDPLCMNMKTSGKSIRSTIGHLYRITVGEQYYHGKTRDPYHREASHKTASKTATTKLYTCIRENGGWDCAKFEVLRSWECGDNELKNEEDNLVRETLADPNCLNSMPASTTPERERELSNERVRRWSELHPEEARESACRRQQTYRDADKERSREIQRRFRESKKNDPEYQARLTEYRREYSRQYRLRKNNKEEPVQNESVPPQA